MIKIALRNPYLIVVLALAILILGVSSYQKIPADLLPIFKKSAVQIVTFYPGMPPEVMERDIMSRLERWTGQSVGIEHQEGKAMLGVCVVKDFFREDISLDTAMSQVTSYAVSDMFYLPPGTIPPMIMPFDPTASLPLCLVSISSPTMSEKDLYDVAYFELRNRLQSIQGVIAPAVYGGTLRRILAYVDREKLQSRGLSLMDVVRALRKFNVLIPAGNIKMGEIDYQIFTNAMPARVEELNEIPIKIEGRASVLLRDVGIARDSHQIQTNIVRINGKRQVYIPIYRQPGANTIQIVDAIKNQLGHILLRLREMDPRAKDLALEVVMDQSVYVRNSITGLQIAAGLGAVLAGLVVLIFLRNLRSTFIISLAIPLSILAAFIGLFYTGDTINAMTLGGLALAIGILIDQSIVVLENIVRHLRQGKSPSQAALDGVQEVALPILISTITFIVVFYPVVFLSGMAKFLFKPLAITVTFAMIASYLFAMTLIPSFCARFLRKDNGQAGSDESDTQMGSLGRFYRELLPTIIHFRYRVVFAVTILFLLAIFLLSRMGTELFPQVDAEQFTLHVRLPSGTRIEKSEATIAEVEKVLMEAMGKPDPKYPQRELYPNSNMQILISNIGVLMDWPAAYTPNTGPMDAFILVQLKGKKGMPDTFDYVSSLRQSLKKRFPEVEFAFDTGGMLTTALNMGEPSPIHIQVSGSNLNTSLEIARIIKRESSEVSGATDVRIAQRLDYPILKVEIDRIKAAYLGVNVEDVVKNLVTATNSSINFDPAFWIDPKSGNHYFIGAQYSEEAINSLETLYDIPITGQNSSRPVMLQNLAKITRGKGPAVINHHNITRVIDVYANVERGYDMGSVVANIERRLEASSELGVIAKTSERGDYYEVAGSEFKGKGYTLNLSGEVHSMRNAFGQFTSGLVIAVILVYLVMVAQFKSFLDPLIIMLNIPLGFIGVSFLMYFTGTNLSIQSFMGIIMTVGIVVEYSIILVDFANRRMEQGMSPPDAILDAARIRLRPILMTSLTTVLALLPMGIGIAGGEANIPLARAIIGGVLGGTVLSLVVVPCFYVLLKPLKARNVMRMLSFKLGKQVSLK